MFELRIYGCRKGLARRAIEHTPYRRTSVRFWRVWAEWVACLKAEVGLDGVYRREIVVLDLAQLQEARMLLEIFQLCLIMFGRTRLKKVRLTFRTAEESSRPIDL